MMRECVMIESDLYRQAIVRCNQHLSRLWAMSADPTFGALECDEQILRMLGQMLQSELAGANPELFEQVGKLMDLRPDIQDEFLYATPIEGGVLYRALEVKFSFTLSRFGFNLSSHESKYAGLAACACIMLQVHDILIMNLNIYIYNHLYIYICVYYLSWLGDFLANLPCRFARTLLEMLQSTLAGMCEKFTEDNPDLTTQEVLAQLNAKYMNEVR